MVFVRLDHTHPSFDTNGLCVYLPRGVRKFIITNTRELLWLILLLLRMYEAYIIDVYLFLRALLYILMSLYFENHVLNKREDDWNCVLKLNGKLVNGIHLQLHKQCMPFKQLTKCFVQGPIVVEYGRSNKIARIDYSNAGTEGVSVQSMDYANTRIFETASKCKSALVIEHVGGYDRINQFLESVDENQIVTISTNGRPTNGARIFINKVQNELKVPIFLFFDQDLGGIRSENTLMYGAPVSPHNRQLTCPGAIPIPYSIFKRTVGRRIALGHIPMYNNIISYSSGHPDLVEIKNNCLTMMQGNQTIPLTQIEPSEVLNFINNILMEAEQCAVDLTAIPENQQAYSRKIIMLEKYYALKSKLSLQF